MCLLILHMPNYKKIAAITQSKFIKHSEILKNFILQKKLSFKRKYRRLIN